MHSLCPHNLFLGFISTLILIILSYLLLSLYPLVRCFLFYFASCCRQETSAPSGLPWAFALGFWSVSGGSGVFCCLPAFARVVWGFLPMFSARLGGVRKPPEPGVETASLSPRLSFEKTHASRHRIFTKRKLGTKTRQQKFREEPPSPFMVSVSSEHYCPADSVLSIFDKRGPQS